MRGQRRTDSVCYENTESHLYNISFIMHTHTHTHTHTRILFLPLSPLPPSFPLSLPLSLSLTHSFFLSFCLPLCPSLSLSPVALAYQKINESISADSPQETMSSLLDTHTDLSHLVLESSADRYHAQLKEAQEAKGGEVSMSHDCHVIIMYMYSCTCTRTCTCVCVLLSSFLCLYLCLCLYLSLSLTLSVSLSLSLFLFVFIFISFSLSLCSF